MLYVKTLVLLDIDGTVLPTRYARTTTRHRGFRDFELVIPPFTPTTVSARPYVLEALNSWYKQGIEIQWLSSWGWKAKYLAQALGLPEFDVFYEPSPAEIFMYARSGRPWKRFAIADAAEDEWQAPVRIIWMDDEPQTGRTEDLEFFLSEGLHPNVAEVKLIRPNGELGLTLKELRLVASLLEIEPTDYGTRRSPTDGTAT